MCYLCKKDQLFKIRNPCCCCTLRCGTLWICIFSSFFGVFLIFLPHQVGIPFDFNSTTANATGGTKDTLHWLDDPGNRFVAHYGCVILQIATALYLGTTVVFKCGGLCNFISGTIWIVCRIIATGFWIPLLYQIFSKSAEPAEEHKRYQWLRYGYLLGTNLVIHIYFLAVIRYYTMESWDIWVYRPRTPDFRHPLRRHIPPAMEAHEKKYKYHKKPDKKDNLTEWRQRRLFHERVDPDARDWNDWNLEGGLPMWHLGKDYLIRGEDYSGFDPIRHYQAFEKLEATGVLDWNEEDLEDEDKMETIRKMVSDPSFAPSTRDLLKNRDSNDTVVPGRGPVLAGFCSGKVTIPIQTNPRTNPVHESEPPQQSQGTENPVGPTMWSKLKAEKKGGTKPDPETDDNSSVKVMTEVETEKTPRKMKPKKII